MASKIVQKKLTLYTPHSKQLEFHNSTARYRVVSFGRQAGKSTAANNELLKRAWEKPNSILWFISPTNDSARIMFNRALVALSQCHGIYVPNKSQQVIKFVNGSKIFYKSGEVLENLRTETLHGVVIDEVRNQDKKLWPLVIRPMLTTTKGWAVFISTPNGFDHFYDMYMHAMSDPTGTWLAMHAPSDCNPLINHEEMEDARRTMSEAEFAQEYLAEFRDLTAGRAYMSFSIDGNVTEKNPFYDKGDFHPGLPILVAMDFNITPMAWTIGQKKVDDFYFFDEIWLKQSHTQEASEVLASKIIELGHQKLGVMLCGDATSKTTGQRAAAGQSDYDIVCQVLDKHGIPWVNMTPESNPGVKDRVNTVNAKLKDGNGNRHVFFHPRCKEAIKDFQRVVWKQGSGGAMLDQTTDRDRTHSSDGVGYAICELSPLVYKKGPTRMGVLNAPGY